MDFMSHQYKTLKYVLVADYVLKYVNINIKI